MSMLVTLEQQGLNCPGPLIHGFLSTNIAGPPDLWVSYTWIQLIAVQNSICYIDFFREREGREKERNMDGLPLGSILQPSSAWDYAPIN